MVMDILGQFHVLHIVGGDGYCARDHRGGRYEDDEHCVRDRDEHYGRDRRDAHYGCDDYYAHDHVLQQL